MEISSYSMSLASGFYGLSFSSEKRQKAQIKAVKDFARTEGIMPAPEATHAIKGAVDEALKCKAEGKSKSILFNLCGHGHFDMQAYMDYFSGNLAEDKFDSKAFEESMGSIPAVN